MLQSISSVFIVYRRKTLTGSLDPRHANGMDKPCTLTKAERYSIMEQAVALCPEITMIIKCHKVRALLGMGSRVTLMNESYFLKNIEQIIPNVDKDHLNAHKLFNLKGVEDGCVPLTKYFSVDIQVGGRLIHDIGILIKKDSITPLGDLGGTPGMHPPICLAS